MTEASDGQVACPNCGRPQRWEPALAGEQVTCACGQVMRLPVAANGRAEPVGAPTPTDEDQLYDLALDDEDEPSATPASAIALAAGHGIDPAELAGSAAGGSTGKCPSCNQSLKPGAVLCVKCGYSLAAGQQLETAVTADEPPADEPDAPAPPAPEIPPALAAMSTTSGVSRALEERVDAIERDRFTEFYLPLGLIVLGVVMRLGEAIYHSDAWGETLVKAFLWTAIEVAIALPLLLAGLLAAGNVLGVSFGTLGAGLFKLLAILFGPGAVGEIAYHVVGTLLGHWAFGALAWLIVAFVTMWVLLARFFDLDGLDALVVLLVLLAIRFISILILWVFMFALLFP